MQPNDVSLQYAISFQQLACRHSNGTSDAFSWAEADDAVAFVHRVEGMEFCNAVAAAARRFGDRNFGLRIGAGQSRRKLGLLGTLMATASTLGDSLVALGRWSAFANALGEAAITQAKDGLRLQWIPFRSVPRAVADEVLAGWIAIVRSLSDDASATPVLELSDDCVDRRSVAESALNCPVRMRAQYDAVILPSELLAHRLRHADTNFHAYLSECTDGCVRVLRAPNSSFLRRVGAVILDGFRGSHASEIQTAEALGLTTRTLQRRLSTTGFSFRQLRDLLRMSIAVYRLDCDGGRVIDIARQIAFAEEASCCRAIRRWAGLSPREIVRLLNVR